MAERDVLIVDNDRQFLEVLTEILASGGYNCRVASDGNQGLDLFRQTRPPLVITDLLHPGTNGIELIREVRRVDPDAAVIVVSNLADAKRMAECLKSGAHAFITKPPDVDELLITVGRALERRQLLIEHRQQQAMASGGGEVDKKAVRLLIVDDDRSMADVFRQVFLHTGYGNCLLAYDGREGLEVFRRTRPDLTITNFLMPRMNGLELLKAILHEDPDAAVLVTSGSSRARLPSLKLGAYAFLELPVNIDELLIAAERALERRQLLIERRQRHERG